MYGVRYALQWWIDWFGLTVTLTAHCLLGIWGDGGNQCILVAVKIQALASDYQHSTLDWTRNQTLDLRRGRRVCYPLKQYCIALYSMLILSTISPCTTGLKAYLTHLNCTSTAQLSNYWHFPNWKTALYTNTRNNLFSLYTTGLKVLFDPSQLHQYSPSSLVTDIPPNWKPEAQGWGFYQCPWGSLACHWGIVPKDGGLPF